MKTPQGTARGIFTVQRGERMDNLTYRVIETLLKKSVTMFRSLQKKESTVDGKFGRFPESATIIYTEFSKDLIHRAMRSIRAWKVTSTELTEIHPPISTPDFGDRCGMYYTHGCFAFSFSSEQTPAKARLEMILGPRYGRGYIYDIVIKDHTIFLDNEQTEWVSRYLNTKPHACHWCAVLFYHTFMHFE